jgi:hypothetical protein
MFMGICVISLKIKKPAEAKHGGQIQFGKNRRKQNKDTAARKTLPLYFADVRYSLDTLVDMALKAYQRPCGILALAGRQVRQAFAVWQASDTSRETLPYP